MSALLQIPAVAIDDYLLSESASEVKHEYLGGTVHAMAGGSNRHNTVALNCLTFLSARLKGSPCQAFNSDTKVRIDLPDHTRFYYPDGMVVCRPNPDTDHYQERPDLVLEVLSDSTRRTDLGEKREAYLSLPSLKTLLFVETAAPEVTLYRRRAEGGFAAEHFVGPEGVVPIHVLPEGLPISEIYDRVEF